MSNINPATPLNIQNPQSSDYSRQKKEAFLAPTPSYNQEIPVTQTPQTEKGINPDIQKGPNSSQYYDMLHHNSSIMQNGQSFFLSPTTPAYGQSQIQANVQYFNAGSSTPNSNVQQSMINYGAGDLNLNISKANSLPPDIKHDISYSKIEPKSYGIISNITENIEPKLQNIVSTANLKCQLDLRQIALQARNAEYNPKRFAAVIMRIKEPKTTALIFASGKMVCTGARSEEDSRKAARQYAKIIQRLGYEVRFSEFKIQNIVGSCDVKFKISLEGLSTAEKSCSYEPEIFPGLIYKMKEPRIVLLIFVSGKIVLTGAKERKEIFDAFRNIYPVLQKYKRANSEITENISGRGDD